MSRLFSLAVVITLVMLLESSRGRAAATDATDNSAGEPYGVCAHLTWRWLYKTDEDVKRALMMMKEAGVQWLRVGLHWDFIESQAGKPDLQQWKRTDQVIAEAISLGIQPYGHLIGTPRWASPEPDANDFWSFAPKDLADWEQFVRTATSRYRGQVRYWEVNNEIDWPPFWKSGLEAYVKYLKVASQIIRQADPQNRVILAGLATDGVNAFEHGGFRAEQNALQRLYDLGAGPYFDVVALHPYSHKVDGAGISVSKVNTAYSVMQRNGDADKPIWCTEIGLSTNHNPPWSDFSEADQARALVDVYSELLGVRPVQKVFWYNFRCKGDTPQDQEHNFGIINLDFSPREAYHAYAKMANANRKADRSIEVPNMD